MLRADFLRSLATVTESRLTWFPKPALCRRNKVTRKDTRNCLLLREWHLRIGKGVGGGERMGWGHCEPATGQTGSIDTHERAHDV